MTNYPVQHGRRYHAYKDGTYILPNDEREQDRLDMAHAMETKLIGDKLFLAPLAEDFAGKVLDAGCGTGIWSICMGDLFPDAAIRGVDLSPIQPSWVSVSALRSSIRSGGPASVTQVVDEQDVLIHRGLYLNRFPQMSNSRSTT